MAREFKLLFLLLFVVASAASAGGPTTITPSSTTTTTTTASPGGPTTTTPSSTTTMTASPGGPTTTTPSSTTTTTTASPGGSTTITPSSTTTTTTASPGGPTTTTPSSTTTTTTASPGGPTTTKPSSNTTDSGGVSTAAPVTATTKPQNPCDDSTCGRGSTCDPRANTYVCLCLAGDSYNNESKSCESAKVFPGELSLPELVYNEKMANKTTSEFKAASDKIVAELDQAFNESETYTGATVLALLPIKKSKHWSRSEGIESKGVSASVEILFRATSDIKTAEVLQKITAASQCENCVLGGADFKDSDVCNKHPCDKKTTACHSTDGLYVCNCMDGYISSIFSSRMCVACPSGLQASESKCVDCSFGYSGLNCNESWQLVLVIVGSVLGGLLLITLILLPLVAIKLPKKSSKKSKDVDSGKPYVNNFPTKAPLVNSNLANSRAPSVNGGSANGQAGFANAGVPRIPRATTTSGWDRGTNLEMTPSNSRQSLIPVGRNPQLYDEPDDMNSNPYPQARPQSSPYVQARPQSNLYTQNRPQSNPYAQNRPQSNPYAQNRPQINPYASSQGQTNAYYTHDDGRRLN